MTDKIDKGANVDFACINKECKSTIIFNLLNHLENNNKQVICPNCHSAYELNQELLEKLKKLRNLILTIKESKEILSDCNVGVATPEREVKIPYLLLLTRMTTMISIELNGTKVDFNFRVEPSSDSEVFK